MLQPGTLDLYHRYSTFDRVNGDFDDWVALAQQVSAATIQQTVAAITDICCDWTAGLSIPTLPGSVDFDFAPGGDFDWAITLRTGIVIDLASQTALAGMDLMNTAHIGYQGPAGSTTYSTSGVFPGTAGFDDLPDANIVPEPATWLLIAVGLAGIACRRGTPGRTGCAARAPGKVGREA